MTERVGPFSARFPFSEPPWGYLTDPNPASFVDAAYSPSTSAAVGGQGDKGSALSRISVATRSMPNVRT
jgi:hypothetical protein